MLQSVAAVLQLVFIGATIGGRICYQKRTVVLPLVVSELHLEFIGATIPQ
jgi:hypothetical protein